LDAYNPKVFLIVGQTGIPSFCRGWIRRCGGCLLSQYSSAGSTGTRHGPYGNLRLVRTRTVGCYGSTGFGLARDKIRLRTDVCTDNYIRQAPVGISASRTWFGCLSHGNRQLRRRCMASFLMGNMKALYYEIQFSARHRKFPVRSLWQDNWKVNQN